MSVAILVRKLAEAGASAEVIALAVEALEAEQTKDSERRAKRAEQKRNERSRRATVARQGSDYLRQIGDIAATVCDPSPIKEAPHTPKENYPIQDLPPSPPSEVQAPNLKLVSRGTSLPEDWQPSDDLFAYGRTLGLTDPQSREILENMRLWARANCNRAIARKADWTSTMQGALRRDASKYRQRAGPRQSNGTKSYATMLAELRGYLPNEQTSFDDHGSCIDADPARPGAGSGTFALAICDSVDKGRG